MPIFNIDGKTYTSKKAAEKAHREYRKAHPLPPMATKYADESGSASLNAFNRREAERNKPETVFRLECRNGVSLFGNPWVASGYKSSSMSSLISDYAVNGNFDWRVVNEDTGKVAWTNEQCQDATTKEKHEQ